jgi:hypothetical protein
MQSGNFTRPGNELLSGRFVYMWDEENLFLYIGGKRLLLDGRSMTDAVFYGLWNPLLSYAVRRGIDQDSAKDLVMDAIMKVIDHFDPERGELLHFAYRVLGNAMKNHFRETNKFGELTSDIADDQPTPHESAVMKEDARRAASLLRSIKGSLGEVEIRLLAILQEQMETEGKIHVSVAARAIGIEPLKAHDILRKLQRKLARSRQSTIQESAQHKIKFEPPPADGSVTDMYSISAPPAIEASVLFKDADESAEYASLLSETRDIGVFVRIAEYVKKIRS